MQPSRAYGHAFVLLAASSAKVAGHPDADRLIADISTVIIERFCQEELGVVAAEYTRDWQPRPLSRPELEHAFDRIVDGGVRSNKRLDVLTYGGTTSRPHRRSPCGCKRLAALEHLTGPWGGNELKLNNVTALEWNSANSVSMCIADRSKRYRKNSEFFRCANSVRNQHISAYHSPVPQG